MAEKFNVKGFEDFVQFIKDLKTVKTVNVLFTGAKDDEGISWCPDCVAATPFLQDAVEKFGDNSVFITVDVGDR
jgi:thiol-disulfide isomerase/thioredoxin